MDLTIDVEDYKLNVRAAVVITHKGKILVHKNLNSDHYALIGGRVEIGEDSETTVKREKMILYLLINNYDESFEKIKSVISENDFKVELNKKIFKTIMEIKDGNKEQILSAISNIEDQDIQAHISEIMVTDYEITSVEKCIEDIIIIYNKERLNNRKMDIIKQLDNAKNLSAEEIAKLEKELNNIIIELAKKK